MQLRGGVAVVLGAAACAVMAAAPAVSLERAPFPRIQVGASDYREDRFDGSAFGPEVDRYDIDIGHFEALAPVGDHGEIRASADIERMSGASPWFVLPGIDGEPVQVMSGATIEDRRTDASLAYTLYTGKQSWTARIGHSDENDYTSTSGALEYAIEFGQRFTLNLGYGYSDDTVEPSDAELFNRILKDRSDARQLSGSLSVVLDPQTVVSFGIWHKDEAGYLSDPYKLVFVGGVLERDARPTQREATALELRLRRYLDAADAALQFDYRYYDDDWGIQSHSASAGWHQNLPGGWSLRPSIRYYSQSAAAFYGPYFLEAALPGGAYSSDFRLSSYGAWSYGLELGARFGDWTLSASALRYDSDEGLGLDGPPSANSALVDFTLVSLSLGWEID